MNLTYSLLVYLQLAKKDTPMISLIPTKTLDTPPEIGYTITMKREGQATPPHTER